MLDLEESDIEGAYLSEPLDKHTIEQLRWWLLYHDYAYSLSDRKKQLIEK